MTQPVHIRINKYLNKIHWTVKRHAYIFQQKVKLKY
jgi:hypothetical protein